MTPVITAQRFLIACGYGGLLGLLYGFLRPLRPRWTGLADTILILAAFRAWLHVSFSLCQGDIRIGYTMGLFLGAFFWEISV